jgi:hypothetical protein
MSADPSSDRPDPSPLEPPHAGDEPTAPPGSASGAPTELLCERCGNVDLVRVKGCWYCEKCHYKFDCYGW